MSITLSNNVKLQENYTLNGHKEYYLIIECKNCSELKCDFFNNQKGISCLFINIYNNRNKMFQEVIINSKNLNIKHDQLKILFDYFKKIKILRINN